MTNLDSKFKSRDIALPTKVCLVKAMVFPVVMYGYESWTIRKAECWRTDASELWCWRQLLRVHWTARGSNQSILKKINPGCSLERLMLKLKLQYFGPLMRRAPGKGDFQYFSLKVQNVSMTQIPRGNHRPYVSQRHSETTSITSVSKIIRLEKPNRFCHKRYQK